MRGPKPPRIELRDGERDELQALLRRRTAAQQLVLRARIVLAAAAGDNNGQITRRLGVSRDMVRLWRARWLSLQAAALDELSVEERLTDAPRPGCPATITAEQLCQMVALACEAPSQAGRPISQWTGREIADEIVKRGILAQISPRHAARLLKRGTCSPT
ncbi:MAG: helix-turn-helix domain-containing protein [Anaerolineales bacterium]